MGQSAIPASFRCAQAKEQHCDEVSQCEPPAREKQPHDVAQEPKWARAYVSAAGELSPRHGPPAEGEQRIGGDIERRARPG